MSTMSSTAKPVKTVIVGFGKSGETLHAKPIVANERFHLAAVADIDENRRETAAAIGAGFYTDYREMIQTEQPDLAVLVSRNDQHAVMACECLRLGCDVLVTKPWALNETEALQMIETASATGRRILPWLPMRWAPDLQRISELVREGAIGEVFHVRRSIQCFRVRHDWQTRSDCGGGYLLNWGPHIVGPAYWILDTEVIQAHAFMRQTINPGDTEDVFVTTLRLKNGAHATAEHTITPLPAPNWVVQGTRGAIEVHGRELTLCRAVPGAKIGRDAPAGPVPVQTETETLGPMIYGDEAEIYADAARLIAGEEIGGFDTGTALHLTRVLDAIRKSNATGEAVNIA